MRELPPELASLAWENELDLLMFDEGGTSPFVLKVSVPVVEEEGVCAFRVVHAPAAVPGFHQIFGVDAAQARELAIAFVEYFLEGRRLTDRAGNPVDLRQALR